MSRLQSVISAIMPLDGKYAISNLTTIVICALSAIISIFSEIKNAKKFDLENEGQRQEEEKLDLRVIRLEMFHSILVFLVSNFGSPACTRRYSTV